MGLYLKVVFLVIMLFATFGFVAPFLISADNTELVLGGVALIAFVVLPLAYILVKGIVKDSKALVNSLSVKEEK